MGYDNSQGDKPGRVMTVPGVEPYPQRRQGQKWYRHTGASRLLSLLVGISVGYAYASKTSMGKIISAALVTGTPRGSHSNVRVGTGAG